MIGGNLHNGKLATTRPPAVCSHVLVTFAKVRYFYILSLNEPHPHLHYISFWPYEARILFLYDLA